MLDNIKFSQYLTMFHKNINKIFKFYFKSPNCYKQLRDFNNFTLDAEFN